MTGTAVIKMRIGNPIFVLVLAFNMLQLPGSECQGRVSNI